MHQINSSGISLYHQPIADVEKNTPKTSHTPERDSDKEYTRRYIEISKSEWWRVILFCLSMSLMGLKFPLGYLFVPMCLISSWRNSRYDFIIQFTIFVGGYAFLSDSTLPFKTEDLAMLLGVIGVFIYRKPPIVKKVLVAVGIYAAALIILAMFSDERMGIQIRTMRYWLCFIYFMVPLMAFAGQNFDIRELMKKIFPYVLVISVFYILDCFIVNGNLFVPNSFVWDSAGSTWNNLALSGFGSFPRKFPPGMYWLLMVVAPIARYYKLKWWQWLLIVGALIAARTFTLIITTVIGLMLFQPKVGRLVGYSVIAIFLFSIAYSIDSSLPKRANGESAMRIKSSIDQIISLGEVEDDEDLSKFGTGRIAQALPIMDLMTAYNK